MMGCLTTLLCFVFFYLNLWFANRGPGLIQIGIPTPTGQITAYTFSPDVIRRAAAGLSLLAAVFFGSKEAGSWEILWRYMYRVPFNLKDPVFGHDISFYFFRLPFYEEVIGIGMTLCFLAGIAVLALYYFKGSLSFRGFKGTGLRGRSGAHISVLALSL